MSTIGCMLHLFGNRLGQKGSTLYAGGFCACAAGGAARAPKKESVIATAEVLVHPIRILIDDSCFPRVSNPSRLWVNFVYERNKKLPAQKAGGRYKSNPYTGDMVL